MSLLRPWVPLLGSKLPHASSFDPHDRPYVGLHTPDTDGDPAWDALTKPTWSGSGPELVDPADG
jgi:hypothetical protein